MSIVRGALLGEWRRQVDLGSEERWCGRVDFIRDDLALVVEVQSERYHSALTDQAHDAARRANLEVAGFTVVEVWDTQLWHAKREVLAGFVTVYAAPEPAAVPAAQTVARAAVSAARTA